MVTGHSVAVAINMCQPPPAQVSGLGSRATGIERIVLE